MIEWQPVLEAGAKSLIPKIFEKALSISQKSFKDRLPYTKLTFEHHFEYAFRRCTLVKTIVNGDAPIKLLENYVNPNFKHKTEDLDEYTFIDKIFDCKRAILVGSAGSGKSMFMRYFWIACSVEPRGKIPIYIELRKYNDISDGDFITYIFNSLADKPDGDARIAFDRAVKEGQFVFILDGYDEIKRSKREECERAILELGRTENVTLVSGRPDDAYLSWQAFSLYEMMPLSLEQTTKLIENIDFEKTVKRKFISQLKKSLYEDHTDLASRPLLATMMLLTFNSFAEIPDKIHVFYDQAFDTLFSRHDATKEAFKRDRSTDYSIDVFKKYFSLFCLLTYHDAKNDFSEAEILETLNMVGKLENTVIHTNEMMQDILDSVCLLQKDGLRYVFSHRSFQEYFTAYSLVRLPENKVSPLLRKFSERTADNVIPMLHDMNSHLVLRTFLSDGLKSYASITENLSKDSFDAVDFLKKLELTLFIQFMSKEGVEPRIIASPLFPSSSVGTVRDIALRLYPECRGNYDPLEFPYGARAYDSGKDAASFRNDFIPTVANHYFAPSATFIYRTGEISMSRRNKKTKNRQMEIVNVTTSKRIESLERWLRDSELSFFLKNEHFSIIKLSNRIAREIVQKEKTMEQIFDLK